MRFLVPFLIIVPALEIALFLLSGQLIGIWWTLFFIFFTGVAGAFIAKKQGLKTVEKLKLELRSGQIPQGPIMDSFCILIGGVLILTPGFITDSLGLSLLLPVTRVFWKRKAKQWFRKWIDDSDIIIMR
ncbi:UPF0716 protein FxsA [Bacillus oleivorans]